MEKRWSGLLLVLLVLLCVSIRCCQAIEENEDAVGSEVFEDEDDLEDLEEGMDDSGPPGGFSSPQDGFAAAAKVANVNDKDVDRVLEKFEFVLLLGYAPWCTQSEELMSEFAAAALHLEHLGNPTLLAKLDAVNNPAAAAEFEILGYPTLVFFVNGTRKHYSGGYSRDGIVLWVRKQTGSASTTISSKEEAQSFLKTNSTAVLGYFKALEGAEHDAFIAAAGADTDTEFVQTTVAEVAQVFAESPVSAPLIAIRKPEPEYFTTFDGSFKKEEITSFVEVNKHPLLTVLNSKNANAVYSSPMKLHVLLFTEVKDYDSVKSVYLEAAKDFKGKVMFVVLDMADQDFAMPMLAVYGLDTKKPVVAALNNDDGSRYLLESEITLENVKKFAADMYHGKLPVYYKSEPVPAQNDGLVKKVVGKNFDEIVMDNTKNVFLYVHTPWCATCDKVGRGFEKLAKHVQDVSSLVLAKYDGQENEHPLLLEVPNYPSLLLYPAGKKSSPIEAETKGSWKKLLVFLNENNVAVPPPVSKDDEADSRREAAELDPSVNDEL